MEEVKRVFKKNVYHTDCIDVIEEIINKECPELLETFVRESGTFLTESFTFLKEMENVPQCYRERLFNSFYGTKKKELNKRWYKKLFKNDKSFDKHLSSHVSCLMRAFINEQKRKYGIKNVKDIKEKEENNEQENKVDNAKVTCDLSKYYLTFIALEDTKFTFIKVGRDNDIQYSLDNGLTWTRLLFNTPSPTVTAGSKILWKAELTPRSSGIGTFSSRGKFAISGNPMSLLYGEDFKGQTDLTGKDYAFYGLFRQCTKLVSSENLSLPATTLAQYCYGYMFQGCTSLTTAPELPATTLAQYCYTSMFQGCTSLTTAPELPATTLAQYCYSSMFNRCTSLTTAPELPATTLAQYCYYGIFYGCSSLTTAPELPATTLAQYCYSSMFEGCTSLTTAPELPATTLTNECYLYMFNGCTSLTTAPELPATNLDKYCYYGMFRGCTNLTKAPVLPATTLAECCYCAMFAECTSLTKAPDLPATTLAECCYASMFYECAALVVTPQLPATILTNECYSHMFYGCTSLTKSPELPATKLSDYCYQYMFNGCSNLSYIVCLATDITSMSCTTNWVNGVAATGTFVKNGSMNSWTNSEDGIPNAWKVIQVQSLIDAAINGFIINTES